MMHAFERFGLLINDRIVRTPVGIASMAGIVDVPYVLERAGHIGFAFIGGYSIDAPTIAAAKSVASGGDRKEFLYEDPVAELKAQIALMEKSDVVLGINLRGSSPGILLGSLAKAIGDTVVYEIDAHCRQPAMVAAGCGEYYLKNPDRLVAVVRALKEEGVTVSVKIRVGVADDDRALAVALWKAGADILHIDLMDAGSAKLRQIRNSCPLLIIANNSITTFRPHAGDALARGRPGLARPPVRRADPCRAGCRDHPVCRRGGLVQFTKTALPRGRHPGAYLLLHAGQGMPAHPDP